MNVKTWILASVTGAIAGETLRISCPEIPLLGVWGVTLMVILLALRFSDIWRKNI